MYIIWFICMAVVSIIPEQTIDVTCINTYTKLPLSAREIVYIFYNACFAIISIVLMIGITIYGWRIIHYIKESGSLRSQRVGCSDTRILRTMGFLISSNFFLGLHVFLLIVRITPWQWEPFSFFVFILLMDVISISVLLSIHAFTQYNQQQQIKTLSSTKTITLSTKLATSPRSNPNVVVVEMTNMPLSLSRDTKE